MKTIAETIGEALSGLTTSGISRVSYMPYRMDTALSVVDRIGKGIDPKFILTPEVTEIYKELIRYFHGDSEFNGDLTKGLLLMGPTGTGKTLAMRIMSIYRQIDDTKFIMKGRTYKMNYEIVDVSTMINMFLNNAFDGIEVYCIRYVLCIDDIGTETDQVKHYGTALDVVSHIISERYAKRLLTFGTTNLPVTTLEDKYDDRIVSRMFALFNFVTMKGNDFRKTK